jgi:uncharacterized membrane protein YkvA (DUF1232 family)
MSAIGRKAMDKLRKFTKTIKDQLSYYRALAKDTRTPTLSKWLIGIAIVYTVSPIDIIPDFIPILGYLDDLIIVPGLIYCAVLLIPNAVKQELRNKHLVS